MSRKRIIWVSVGLIVLCGVIAGYALSKWMNGMNAGTVQVGTPTAATTPQSQPVVLKTGYFTATLPADFSVKRQSENTGNASLLQLMASTPSATDEQFAVTVGTLPAGGLQDVGDYHLRVTQTEQYTPYTPAALPNGAIAFRTVSGPAAFVVFWPHGARYTEIALTTDGVASLDQLEHVLTQVVSSWQWLG